VPLAVFDKRPAATWRGEFRNWTWVLFGNFAGALTVALLMAIIVNLRLQRSAQRLGPESRPYR